MRMPWGRARDDTRVHSSVSLFTGFAIFLSVCRRHTNPTHDYLPCIIQHKYIICIHSIHQIESALNGGSSQPGPYRGMTIITPSLFLTGFEKVQRGFARGATHDGLICVSPIVKD